MPRPFVFLIILAAAAAAPLAHAAEDPTRIGDVSTTFRIVGRNDRIVVDRYDDPKVGGVSCYLSRAETGGVSGSLGLATDPSRFSIACRATGAVAVPDRLPANEVVFGASANWLFKEIRVSRMWDAQKRVLVYLVWSTQALSRGGSPYNSVLRGGDRDAVSHAQHTLAVQTSGPGLTDITAPVRRWAEGQGAGTGLLTLWCRHTSCSLLVQENASPDVRADLMDFFARLAPHASGRYRHANEGPDDMPAHLRSALTQPGLSIPVGGGSLVLGTWQGIYLFEHRDAPHRREVVCHLSW